MFGFRNYVFIIFVNLVFAKIFNKCDLAKILRYKHHLTYDQVNIWVCLAKYQSNFNSAIVNYDGDGVGYHGLYQISDRYWCSRSYSDNNRANVCNINCDKFRDEQLTDDFECIGKIFEEHTRLSGSGYNAWTAFNQHCSDNSVRLINDCFNELSEINQIVPYTPSPLIKHKINNKIYHRCELARELRFVHDIPMEQIATWVCIAKHESGFNTSAIGRLNQDGSEDHGIFQISDIYWCSPPGNGWVCGLSCDKLEDSDITDDVQCMRKIYAEHQRLFGDGFNAWAVYRPHCQYQADQYIDACFDENDDKNSIISSNEISRTTTNDVAKSKVQIGKIFKRCELAVELRDKHKIPKHEIATWVCIAHHESRYNTSAIGQLNADGSADHGLFQISDIYWCSPPGKGWACGLSCSELEDSDITDDVQCMKKIHKEHQRLSGDGFNAWAVYKPYCKGRSEEYTNGCFDDDNYIPGRRPAVTAPPKSSKRINKPASKGKIYDRCELARELRYKYNLPTEQISTWVCIAKHESSFNTSAIGRLNADGSEDHGLFQISDIYWCSPPGKGWVCGLSCSDLEDNDISDDVECMKKIHEEHQRLSGDGFNAWAVYNPHCRGRSDQYTVGCFDNDQDNDIYSDYYSADVSEVTSPKPEKHNVGTGKVYNRCELALELRDKHGMSEKEIATWVCIAKHESNFNTSAIGRLNGDGSEDHGLFQISDIYWCSPPGKGWVCGLSCADLENNDITDDVECMKQIYEEHQRLSGDGFNAWAVYRPYCKNRSDSYTKGCFENTTTRKPDETTTETTTTTKRKSTTTTSAPTTKRIKTTRSTIPTKTSTTKQIQVENTITSTKAIVPSTTTPSIFDIYLKQTKKPSIHKYFTLSEATNFGVSSQKPKIIYSTQMPPFYATKSEKLKSTTIHSIKSITKPYFPTTTTKPTSVFAHPNEFLSAQKQLFFNQVQNSASVKTYQWAQINPTTEHKRQLISTTQNTPTTKTPLINHQTQNNFKSNPLPSNHHHSITFDQRSSSTSSSIGDYYVKTSHQHKNDDVTLPSSKKNQPTKQRSNFLSVEHSFSSTSERLPTSSSSQTNNNREPVMLLQSPEKKTTHQQQVVVVVNTQLPTTDKLVKQTATKSPFDRIFDLFVH